jgi:N-acetylneuraminic acid mutarotase
MTVRCSLAVAILACSCGGSELAPDLVRALDNPQLGVAAHARGSGLAFDEATRQFVYKRGAFEARLASRTSAIYIKRNDVQTGVTLTPSTSPFALRAGRERSGAVVYASTGDESAVALSPRANGVKEDIVLSRAIGDRLVFEWDLALDPGLTARVNRKGDVEITGRANKLLYRIPAPVIKQSAREVARDRASFDLEGNRLRLVASDLGKLAYPVSIDPTVIVTTNADFSLTGNLESGVTVAADTLSRTQLGLAIGAWTPISSAAGGSRQGPTSVAYDGHIYVLGGFSTTQGYLNDVQVAPINADGSLGSFVATTPFSNARDEHSSVVANGFLYVIGGTGAGFLSDVQVARIQSDGTVGPWSATTTLPAPRTFHASAAHDNFLYVVGGNNGTSDVATVLFAPMRADGTLGAWGSTTALPAAVSNLHVAVYGQYLYEFSGTSVNMASFNADGTIGAWSATTPLPYDVSAGCVARGGYFYCVDATGSPTAVAPINANGTVGQWIPLIGSEASSYGIAVGYGDFVYDIGRVPTLVAPVIANGTSGAFSQTTPFVTGRRGAASVTMQNGAASSLWVLGGRISGSWLNDVQYAGINPDGTVGPFFPRSPFNEPREALAAAEYNGTVYIVGGWAGAALSDIQWSQGGPWTTLANGAGPRAFAAATAYNNVLYISGGFSKNLISGASVYSNAVFSYPIHPDGSLTFPGGFGQTFPTPRAGHVMAAYNGYLYIAGGCSAGDMSTYTCSNQLSDVLVAPIGADGSIGTFVPTTSLPQPAIDQGFAHNGQLTLIGAGYRAPIRSDGTLGAWSAGAGAGGGKGYATAATSGYAYRLGGDPGFGSFVNTVVVGPTDPSGNVTAIGPATPLPASLEGLAAVVNGSSIFVTGGYDGVNRRNDTFVAPIQTDGTLGAFNLAAAFGTPREQHTSVAYADHLYVIGGYNGVNALGDVQAASIAGGSVGPWTTFGAGIPGGRYSHASVAYAGHLYVLGGFDGFSRHADVMVASINADGSIGAFATTTNLPTARSGLSSFGYNGHIYALGGFDGTNRLNDVLVAAINANGTLGPWTQTTAFEVRRDRFAASAFNGRAYIFGGSTGNTQNALCNVQSAPILSNGTLGDWSASLNNIGCVSQHAAVVQAGFFYVLGGFTGSFITSSTQKGTLVGPVARGTYSKLVDLGGLQGSVDDIIVNGSSGLGGTVRLRYQVAPPTGGFGPIIDKGIVPLGAPVLLGDTGVRYVWVNFELDDLFSVAANVDATNQRDVTDFSIDYSGPCARVVCTASDQCHDVGTCDPSNGICSDPPKVNGSPCDDGNVCTRSDSCQSGVCVGTNPIVCTAQDQCHVAGTCDPATGQCSNPTAPNGAPCNDGNLCTTADACANGVCGGTPVGCVAQDQCHQAGMCDPSTGQCSNPTAPNGAPCTDGNLCTTVDACANGICSGTLVVCVAQDQCHVAGTCDASTGQCSNPPRPDGTSCNDGNLCTSNDVCASGVCGGMPVTCTAQDQCHLAGTCNPATGQCTNPPAANGSACNDGNLCTTGDACSAGVCSGTPFTCTAIDQCHVAGTCNPTTGACSNPPAGNGTVCNDGNLCTNGETCQNGICSSSTSTVVCNALDQCHLAGTCDPATGICSNPIKANGTTCDDGRACTTGDACQAGVCTPAAQSCPCSSNTDCVPIDQCHLATCDLSTGRCSNQTEPDGVACNDGNACTSGETCQAGVCSSPTSVVTCTPLDECHNVGVCDSGSGVCSNPPKPNGSSCSVGTCIGGVCNAQPDGGVTDAASADAATADAAVIDATIVDAASTDGQPIDAARMDASISDAQRQDSATMDASMRDSGSGGAGAGGADGGITGEPPGGCGCRIAGARQTDCGAALTVIMLVVVSRGRRRRSR